MSWLAGLARGEEPPPYKDTSTDKVPDPSIPNRMVSNKSANQPFLAYVLKDQYSVFPTDMLLINKDIRNTEQIRRHYMPLGWRRKRRAMKRLLEEKKWDLLSAILPGKKRLEFWASSNSLLSFWSVLPLLENSSPGVILGDIEANGSN